MFKKNRQKQKGFTALELVVVIAIFGVLASVVLFRFSNFNNGVTLFNLTQDIALSVRQAQNSAILGLYPRGSYVIEDIDSWKPRYGLYFSTEPDQNDRFWYYFDGDTNNQGAYYFDNPLTGSTCMSVGTECLDEVVISTGERIVSICDGSNCSLSQVAVYFERPFPDMSAHNNNPGDFEGYGNDITIVVQGFRELEDQYRAITITPLGQVTVRSLSDEEIIGDGQVELGE